MKKSNREFTQRKLGPAYWKGRRLQCVNCCYNLKATNIYIFNFNQNQNFLTKTLFIIFKR